jgi:hypothetical protein
LARNWKFESISLQRGVRCELDTLGRGRVRGAVGVGGGAVAVSGAPLSPQPLSPSSPTISTSNAPRRMSQAPPAAGNPLALGGAHLETRQRRLGEKCQEIVVGLRGEADLVFLRVWLRLDCVVH